MGFLSNIFGKKQQANTKANFGLYKQIIELIVVSETLKATLQTELKRALEHPQSFYDDDNAFMLSDRGLYYTKDMMQTPRFVLIDIMLDNGEMVEIDWKENEAEIRTYLNELCTAKHYHVSITDDNLYEGMDTDTILQLISEKELQPQGYSIAIIDIDSDSYVFTMVPLENERVVRELFAQL